MAYQENLEAFRASVETAQFPPPLPLTRKEALDRAMAKVAAAAPVSLVKRAKLFADRRLAAPRVLAASIDECGGIDAAIAAGVELISHRRRNGENWAFSPTAVLIIRDEQARLLALRFVRRFGFARSTEDALQTEATA